MLSPFLWRTLGNFSSILYSTLKIRTDLFLCSNLVQDAKSVVKTDAILWLQTADTIESVYLPVAVYSGPKKSSLVSLHVQQIAAKELQVSTPFRAPRDRRKYSCLLPSLHNRLLVDHHPWLWLLCCIKTEIGIVDRLFSIFIKQSIDKSTNA